MVIDNRKDIRLIGRAVKAGWNVDREEVLEALMEVIRNRDPDLLLPAIDLARKMDVVDLKREELEIKTKANDDAQRLRLLELARSVPIEDLARIASANGIVSESNGEG